MNWPLILAGVVVFAAGALLGACYMAKYGR